MRFEDFVENFSSLIVVHVDLNAFYNDSTLMRKNFKWKCKEFHNEFRPGFNSGGGGGSSLNDDSFWYNPQYIIRVADCDLSDYDDKANLIVSLMQKNSIEKRLENYGGSNDEPIQLRLYRILENYHSLSSISSHMKFDSEKGLTFMGDSGKNHEIY
jgi:hypothetical protein